MQIFSEVTFCADTGLSLQTGTRTLAQGSLIYRFKHALLFVKSGTECQLVTLEVTATWARSVAIPPMHR